MSPARTHLIGLGAVALRDVEVVGGGDEAPGLCLHGKAADLALAAGVNRWHVALSHIDRVAMAVVLAEGLPPIPGTGPTNPTG